MSANINYLDKVSTLSPIRDSAPYTHRDQLNIIMAESSSTADLDGASVYISDIQVHDSISIRIKFAEGDANLFSFLNELANQVNLTLDSYASDPDTVMAFSDDTWSARGLTNRLADQAAKSLGRATDFYCCLPQEEFESLTRTDGCTLVFSESPNDLKKEFQSDREPDKSEGDTDFPEKSTHVVEQGHGDHKERPGRLRFALAIDQF